MTRADWFAAILAFSLLPFLYVSFWNIDANADAVRIMVDGEKKEIVSLKRDQLLSVEGKLGTSLIAISEGTARFIESPCRGKQCIHSGRLRHGGEFTACLPNRISLTILSNEQRFDTINF